MVPIKEQLNNDALCNKQASLKKTFTKFHQVRWAKDLRVQRLEVKRNHDRTTPVRIQLTVPVD